MKEEIAVTAVWLRRIGDRAEVLVEMPGYGWRIAITEHAEANYGHIAEARGAKTWPLDHLDAPDGKEA